MKRMNANPELYPRYQAQHIIPAETANHPVLQKIGMNLDDASNGMVLRVPANDILISIPSSYIFTNSLCCHKSIVSL